MRRHLFDAPVNVLVVAKDGDAFVTNSQRFESRVQIKNVPTVGGAKDV